MSQKTSQSRISKQRGTGGWGENPTHLVHHEHLISNGKWGKELLLMQIYKSSWCDQSYVWEAKMSALLLTEHPSSGVCELESFTSLLETNNHVQKLTANSAESPIFLFLNPMDKQYLSPPASIFLHHHVSLCCLRRQGWFNTSRLYVGRHVNTWNTKTK